MIDRAVLWVIRKLVAFGLPTGGARIVAVAVPLLMVIGAILLGVRACDRKTDALVETAVEKGRGQERAAGNEKVISDAEKVQAADAAIRGSTVTERMREDPNCRDCADGI